MAYRKLDYALAARSLPEDHPHAIHTDLPTPTRTTALDRKASFITKLKAKISRRDLQAEAYDDDAASLKSSNYSQDVEANMDGVGGRRSALTLSGDDQLMAEAMKKHEQQKALFRAPSKHGPDTDASSRVPSTLPSSTIGAADVYGIVQSQSKPRICTELATWAQFPSHTRADRCASAGRADAMSTIDFGDPSRLRNGLVTPTIDEPQPPMTALRRRTTNASKKSKKRRGLVKSTSQGLEGVGRYYSNLFSTANFRGNNRRTSVSASTGYLHNPELEMLSPATALDSHLPVHDHLKKVDQDLGILSSTFRIPSFSKTGHHHDKGTAEDDDEPHVGPDEEENSALPDAAPEPARKTEWGRSTMPFRKLSTFFFADSKTHKDLEEEGEPPVGPGQLDGACGFDALDTLDSIEGADAKSR